MPDSPSIFKAAIAGAIGGLAGAAAKMLAEAIAPPRAAMQTAPPAVLVERAAGTALAPAQQGTAAQSIHWTFGTAIGVVYGVLAEYYPAVTERGGAEFGVVLWALAHEVALPAFRLTPPVARMSVYEQGNELSTHAVYGMVTEWTRRSVRAFLR